MTLKTLTIGLVLAFTGAMATAQTEPAVAPASTETVVKPAKKISEKTRPQSQCQKAQDWQTQKAHRFVIHARAFGALFSGRAVQSGVG
jgi:uncharacterized membrane protein YgcG